MSRTPEQVLTEHLTAFCPDGFAWSKDEASNLAGLLYPLATLVSDAEADLDALKLEINPGTSTLLLSDYETVLGPDPCGRDALAVTTSLRQALAYQRWTAEGGCSLGFFEQMAAALGVTITIEEPYPPVCGVAICGEEVCGNENLLYDWIVHVTAGTASLEADAAICGMAVCGMSLCGSVVVPAIANEAQDLYCPMQRNSPADTNLYIVDQELT
jgi:uncharacterized protein YmfQ (DUF2313 family)